MLRFIREKVLTFSNGLNGIVSAIISSVNSFLFYSRQGRCAVSQTLYKQIYFTGIEAFPIVSWIAILLVGIITASKKDDLLLSATYVIQY